MQPASVSLTIKRLLPAHKHHRDVAPTWAGQSPIDQQGAPLVAWLKLRICTQIIQQDVCFFDRWASGLDALPGRKGLLQGGEDELGGGQAGQVSSCRVSGSALPARTGCKRR